MLISKAALRLVQALTTTYNAFVSNLAASNGPSLVGWIRAGASAVAVDLKRLLGWQEISAFEFMTLAQIASYQASDGLVDHAAPLQAWINACTASAASGGKLIGRLPPGGGRVGTTLTLPGGMIIRGHGISSLLKGWGVPIFQVTGDHVSIEDVGLFGYTNAGVSDPRTQDAITTNGTLAAKNNYLRLKRLYLQGWNRCLTLQYTDNSVVDDVTTINSNVGVRFYGQCVNNSICNSRIIVNGGTASIQTAKNGADTGEGLMVTNCLLASGASAFVSDGFLAVGFYNCVCDLCTSHVFDMNTVINFICECPWVYSSGGRCFNFQDLGAPQIVDASISVGLATTTAATSLVRIGTNNNGVVIANGTFFLNNAGGVPLALSGNDIVVGPIIVRNANSNSDAQVNGTNIRISQEALLKNGIQTVVSQIRSVASAAATTLPYPTGAAIERITVTGNTACTLLNDPTFWPGKIVVLVFTGTPTWTDGGNLRLNGNFVATADDTLTLVSDGTVWHEVARSVN